MIGFTEVSLLFSSHLMMMVLHVLGLHFLRAFLEDVSAELVALINSHRWVRLLGNLGRVRFLSKTMRLVRLQVFLSSRGLVLLFLLDMELLGVHPVDGRGVPVLRLVWNLVNLLLLLLLVAFLAWLRLEIGIASRARLAEVVRVPVGVLVLRDVTLDVVELVVHVVVARASEGDADVPVVA